MFLKKHKNASPSEETDPKESAHIRLGPASHHGIPRTSSKLAFDPAQRLLAIGTLDGKIKLIGKTGVEGILVSSSQSRCKFLEFANNQGFLVSVTAENDLQIWDLEKRECTQTHRWHTNVTAFAVIQGSPFMYIGEDSGDIAVLQYDREEIKLRQMPYHIALNTTRGKSLNSSPSVIGILPFPETIHSRVLIAYSDGVILAWSIFDSHVKGLWVISGKELDGADFHSDGDEDEEEKDICCICWADAYGGLLGVGYTDGDIWLWDLAITSTRPSSQSSVPSVKLQLSSEKSRSPVLALRWCAAGAREATTSIGGHLFVYGGGEFGCSEALMVCSLKTVSGQSDKQNLCHVDIPLEGLFEDMILLPGAGATFVDQASALLVLTSQGNLHAYDEASITKCLEDMEERSSYSLPESVPVNPFITEPSITFVKLAELVEDEKAADVLSQLPRHFRGNLPSVLPGGTKWPVTGGILSKHVGEKSKVKAVLITGHIDGSVNVWDASTSVLLQICNLPASVISSSISAKLPENTSALAISRLEFCSSSGILVVARGSSVVFVYRLSAEPGEVTCIFLENSKIQDQQLHQSAGFQCVAVLNAGVPVSSISISNHYEHVAVGHTDGTVLLFNVDLCSFVFHKINIPNGQKHIRYLTFGHKMKVSTPVESSTAVIRPLGGVLYAVLEDSVLVALLYNNAFAITCGPWHIDRPSKVLYLHCLELSNEQKDEGMTVPSVEQCSEENKLSQASDLCSCYLLLCTQASAYLYSCSVSNQMVSLTSIKTTPFSIPCSCASANAHGLVLLNNAATLEIRSLPNLDVVKQISLAGVYNLDPKISENPAFLCGEKGLTALVDVKRELIMFSILSADENLRPGDPAVSFFDKDVAAAGEAALKAGAPPPRRKSQLQGLIGGVLKDLKVGGVLKEIKGGFLKVSKSGKEESTGPYEPDDLFKLFVSPLVAESFASPQLDKRSHEETTDSAHELDIDDIIIDDEEEPGSSEKVAASPKGKEKLTDPEDDRAKLFGDDEGYGKPVRRSPDEIRAKYGHRPLGDVAGAAGLARDKLLERQEKLQALGKRTEEMQEGAQNFASMAAELAKTMEGRKWWQL